MQPFTLGADLYAARAARGVSIRELEAADDDLTRATISRIERGERVPNATTLAALARALDLRIIFDGGGVQVVHARRRRRPTGGA